MVNYSTGKGAQITQHFTVDGVFICIILGVVSGFLGVLFARVIYKNNVLFAEMNKIPKRVVPKEKADYEYLLGECDAYVRQFGGRIRGEVDYQKWQAIIDLYLEHFEFCDREALTLLKEIAERAENVTFSMKDGLIRMSVFIGYFDEVY